MLPNTGPTVNNAKPHILCARCESFWKLATSVTTAIDELLGGGDNVPSMPQHLLLAPNRSLVQLSAASGCHFCSIIVGCVAGCTGDHPGRQFVNEEDGPIYISISLLDPDAGSFLLTLFPCDESKIMSHDQILSEHPLRLNPRRGNVLRSIGVLEVDFAPGHPESEHSRCSEESSARLQEMTFSDATANFITTWIINCQRNHPLCGEDLLSLLLGTKEQRARPRRLLDLQACQDLDIIRVVEAEDGLDLEFCALSYSWGFSEPYVMKFSNLADFQIAIHVKKLPKLLQGAVEVARGLRYRYLWIDALCIMQDGNVSPEASADWVDQAGKMDDIFGSAAVTIAASECFDGNSALIVPRHPLSQLNCRLNLGAGAQYDVVPSCTPHCLLHPFDKGRYHLDSRAWVFQERILSPRTVHLTRNFVHLECRTELCCGAMDGPDACHHSGVVAKADYQVLFSILSPNGLDESAHGAFLSFWHELVRRFSTMNLSRKPYRLVALAGLAKQVQAKSKLTWSFGLWRECFLNEMLWYVRGGKGMPYRERAPTWSWASIEVEGPQIMHEPSSQITFLAHVAALPEPTVFVHQPDAPVGQAKHYVKVAGHLRAGAPDRSKYQASGGSDQEGRLSLHHNCRGMPDAHKQCPFHPDSHVPDNIELYSLLVAHVSGTQQLRGKPQTWKTYTGIVLTPVQGSSGRYRRVGYFHIDASHEAVGDDARLPWLFEDSSRAEVQIV